MENYRKTEVLAPEKAAKITAADILAIAPYEQLQCSYARDIRGLSIDWYILDSCLDDYETNSDDQWVRIFVGFRTNLAGGVDDDMEVTHLRTSWVMELIRDKLFEMSAAVEAAYLNGDTERLEELGMDLTTGQGYIAVVVKCVIDDEYIEYIIDENSQHVTAIVPVERW